MECNERVEWHLGEASGSSGDDKGRTLGDQKFQRLSRRASHTPVRQPAHAYACADFKLDDVDAVAERDD